MISKHVSAENGNSGRDGRRVDTRTTGPLQAGNEQRSDDRRMESNVDAHGTSRARSDPDAGTRYVIPNGIDRPDRNA